MNRAGLTRVFAGGQTSVAPVSQETNMSNAERSKVVSNVCERRSPSPIRNRAVATSTRAVTFACDTSTPFGDPVLPEVKSTYAGAPGSTAGGRHCSAATRSARPTTVCAGQRCAKRPTSASSGRTIRQRLGLGQEGVELGEVPRVGDDRAAPRPREHRRAACSGIGRVQRHIGVPAQEGGEDARERRLAALREDGGRGRGSSGASSISVAATDRAFSDSSW